MSNNSQNTKSRLFRYSSIAAGLLLTGTAWSAVDESRFPIDINEAKAKSQAHFERMDTNQNGSISMAEFEAAELPSPGGDKHRRPGKRAHHQGRHAQMQAVVEAEMFDILDTDGDGTISRAEHEAGSQGVARKLARKRAMFRHLDKDDDNVLSADEMFDPGQRLRQADTDGDGFVSKQEMQAQRQTRRQAHAHRQAG